MKMRNIFALTLLVFFFNSIFASTITQSENQTQEQVEYLDSYQTVLKFLMWYKENYDVANNFHYEMTSQEEKNGDFPRHFTVNFEVTERYLLNLKSSKYISENYIDKWRAYFKKCQEDFKSEEYDLPEGFDYDFILWTQDVYLNGIDSAQKVEMVELANTATVKIDIGMKLKFYLSRNKGIWLIDNIENN